MFWVFELLRKRFVYSRSAIGINSLYAFYSPCMAGCAEPQGMEFAPACDLHARFRLIMRSPDFPRESGAGSENRRVHRVNLKSQRNREALLLRCYRCTKDTGA